MEEYLYIYRDKIPRELLSNKNEVGHIDVVGVEKADPCRYKNMYESTVEILNCILADSMD